MTKRFDELTAVNAVTFEVPRGEVFGFLGPNGAGKTTTIHMLTTLLKPTDGDARVAGYDVETEPDRVRERIGVVFQESVLDNYLTGWENLGVHASLWGLSRRTAEPQMRTLLELVELTDRAHDRVEKYSGGMRRRLEIARSLLTQPDVLFLDEPTLGLDPTTRRHIWEYIQRIRRADHVTIFLTTHYMDEAQQLCDRVGIIDHGRIVVIDSPRALIDSLGGDIVEVAGQGELAGAQAALGHEDYVHKTSTIDGSGLSCTVTDAEAAVPKILRRLSSINFAVGSVSIKKPTLDDVFIHYTGRTLREEGAEPAWKRAMIMRRLRK